MKRPWKAVGMILLSLTLSAGGAFAQSADEADIRFTDSSGSSQSRINELEAELASLKSRLDSGAFTPASQSTAWCCADGDGGLRTGLQGAFELVWMKPHFADDTAFILSDFGNFESVPFDNEYEMTARFWIAHHWEDGWGARFRYWNYDKNAVEREATVPAGGDAEARLAIEDSQGFDASIDGDTGEVMLARHGLELHTADWEVTNQFVFKQSQVTLSGGLRYLSLRNDYSVLALSPDLSVSESLLFNQRFEGAGPLLGIEINRPLGDSGLTLFTGARGSVMFGDASMRVIDTAAGRPVTTFRQIDSDESIAIGELNIGMRYSVGTWFVQGGWEGQIWTNAGNPTRNTGELGFHGFSLALGFNR